MRLSIVRRLALFVLLVAAGVVGVADGPSVRAAAAVGPVDETVEGGKDDDRRYGQRKSEGSETTHRPYSETFVTSVQEDSAPRQLGPPGFQSSSSSRISSRRSRRRIRRA